jgi:hypothetical protein
LEEGEKSAEHQGDGGDPGEACQSFAEPLIVSSQTAEASQPGEGAFYDPAARQQDKAPFGFLQFDDQQVDPYS